MYSFGIAVWEMLARSRPIIGKANIDFAILYATVKGRSGVSNYAADKAAMGGWGCKVCWVGLILV